MKRTFTFLIAAVLMLMSSVAWGQTRTEVVAYTLEPATGSNNSYTGNCDITIDGITWNLTGNSQQIPWRIGGKSISNVDRPLYSKTAISDNISKIEVTHGAASSITVNSWTVIVATDANFTNVVSTLTPTFKANATTSIDRPAGADWTNCYYKFVYNVSVTGSSNKFIEFTRAKFYKEEDYQATFTVAAPETVTPGEEFDVEVSITGDYEAHTLTYFFNYDADVFEFQSKTNGEVLNTINSGGNMVMDSVTPGRFRLGIVCLEDAFSEVGVLFTATFIAKTDASAGSYTFENEVETFCYYSVGELVPEDVPFTIANASVTVPNVSGVVTLHTNGVVGEPQTVYGSIELPTAENVAGYAFAGWTADENNIQLVANPYTPSGTVDLYAVYSEDSGDYVKVTSNLDNFSGEYLIVYEDGSLAFDGSLETLDAASNTVGVTIDNGTIAYNATIGASSFTIAALAEGGYSIKSASGKYIGRGSDSNGLDTNSDVAYVNRLDYDDENDEMNIVGAGGAHLRYNSAQGDVRFRYYKSSTYTGQKAIQLYKRATYYTRVFAEAAPLTDVTITGPSVIPAGYTLEVTGQMSNTNAAKLVIEDGAQLVHNSDNVKATVRKNVTGYGASDGGWHLFASPVDDAATPLKTDSYDLFKYNEPTHYWYNDKVEGHEISTLEKGVGYLYAIPEDQMVQLAGTLVPAGTTYTIDLSYTTESPIEGGQGTENNPLPGFNLVGNPFACDAYVDRDYMVLTTAGDGFVNGDGAISPFQGVFVQASATGESVTFSRTPSNNGSKITLNISQTRGEIIDNTTVAFGEGSGMYKFYLNSEATRLYIPKGNTDYAVAYAEGENEMPVNFVAAKNGTYTISVVTKNIAMDYLHLIDNLTGADVDLITTPSYTFEARTSDYASRFRLLFRTNGIEEPVAVEHFAYITNGNLVIDDIDGEALVQIIDQTGRILSSERFSGSYSKQVEGSAGLYFVRLVTGNMVRTQKIVIE